jgi:hypothetical protein
LPKGDRRLSPVEMQFAMPHVVAAILESDVGVLVCTVKAVRGDRSRMNTIAGLAF